MQRVRLNIHTQNSDIRSTVSHHTENTNSKFTKDLTIKLWTHYKKTQEKDFKALVQEKNLGDSPLKAVHKSKNEILPNKFYTRKVTQGS